MEELRRNICGIALRAKFASEMGLPLSALLEGTGIKAHDLGNPSVSVEYCQEFQVIRNLLRHCGDRAGLGVEVGQNYRFTTLGVIGFALVSSENLRSAFDFMLRYADLCALLVPIQLDLGDKDLRIKLVDNDLPDDVKRFALEEASTAHLMVAQDMLGHPITPRSIEYRFNSPPDIKAYQRVMGATPLFAQDKNSLVLPQADVDEPLPRANPLALSIAEDQCRQLVASWKARSGLAAQVRDYIARRPANIPSMEEVASSLLITTRTLRRRLEEEGTHYLALCDEVRQAMAEQLLAIQQMPISQVAEQLGYSEPSSFIHAFKRWKGLTPHAYRQLLTG